MIESNDSGVDMIVEDDGSGFPFSGAYSLDELEILRLGPRSIKRRVRTLGGDLTITLAATGRFVGPRPHSCMRFGLAACCLVFADRVFAVRRFHAYPYCRAHQERSRRNGTFTLRSSLAVRIGIGSTR